MKRIVLEFKTPTDKEENLTEKVLKNFLLTHFLLSHVELVKFDVSNIEHKRDDSKRKKFGFLNFMRRKYD